jgi:spore maturation protein CgeB
VRIVMFYHSLISDWNHGNAHFLRGVVRELLARGHDVKVLEPANGWSLRNLLEERGESAIDAFRTAYPELDSIRYDPDALDLNVVLDGADLVLVHEWNAPELVASIGAYRARSRSFRLLFHDTHHRAVSARDELARYDLRDYDGVLAFGDVLRERYLEEGWTRQAWTWHEAADVRTFKPQGASERCGDLVWVGNWGDGERSQELQEFLLEPVAQLSLHACVHGVRYPIEAQRQLERSGARYHGSLYNFEVPAVFARHALTVHVPRRYYASLLPGIPTIRVFEALACGIPLISAPWKDSEGLFRPGEDYLVAKDGREMAALIREVKHEPGLAASLSVQGLSTILARHTCAHRVDELLNVVSQLDAPNTKH